MSSGISVLLSEVPDVGDLKEIFSLFAPGFEGETDFLTLKQDQVDLHFDSCGAWVYFGPLEDGEAHFSFQKRDCLRYSLHIDLMKPYVKSAPTAYFHSEIL